jgi:endoglucanase
LTSIAKDSDIPYQVNALPKAASNDAAALQLSRGGQATAVVAIPNRYMHSPVEVVALKDLDNAAELIARFCLSLTPDCDFTP